MVSADGINVLHFCKFDLISVIVPEPRKLFCIPASASDAAAVNSSGIKTRLANGWSIFSVNGKPAFNNGQEV